MASRIASRHPRLAAWRDMAASPVLAVLVAAVMIMIAPAALPAAAPVLLLWFVAPEVAIWVRRLLPPRPDTISNRQSVLSGNSGLILIVLGGRRNLNNKKT